MAAEFRHKHYRNAPTMRVAYDNGLVIRLESVKTFRDLRNNKLRSKAIIIKPEQLSNYEALNDEACEVLEKHNVSPIENK